MDKNYLRIRQLVKVVKYFLTQVSVVQVVNDAALKMLSLRVHGFEPHH